MSECVRVLLLGVFAGEHGLWRLTERLDPYDMATLTGDPGVDLREFHDVRLGRMSDAVWDAGPERLLSALSLRVVEWARLDLGTLHFDTTTLSFYGAYEEDLDDSWTPELDAVLDPRMVPQRAARSESSVDGDGRAAPVVTHGYAKNGRHDLKQILFGLVVAGDGAVPLYGRAVDGNASDITAAAAFLDHLHAQIRIRMGRCSWLIVRGGRRRVWNACVAIGSVCCHACRARPRWLARWCPAWIWRQRRVCSSATATIASAGHGWRIRDCDYTYTVAEPVLDDAGLPTRDESGALITREMSHTLPRTRSARTPPTCRAPGMRARGWTVMLPWKAGGKIRPTVMANVIPNRTWRHCACVLSIIGPSKRSSVTPTVISMSIPGSIQMAPSWNGRF